MLAPEDLFSLDDLIYHDLFEVDYVWDVLKVIKSWTLKEIDPNIDGLRENGDLIPETVVLHKGNVIHNDIIFNIGGVGKGEVVVKHKNEVLKGASVIFAGSSFLGSEVQIGDGVVVEPGALFKDGCIIGDSSEVRQGAYLRGSCIVGERCVVGHTTEMKNSVMLDDAKAGHFAYIGDSILGNNVNLGAGTKLANLKINGSQVTLRIDKKDYETGLRKFGAIMGDGVETGCNSVTNPGTILGPKTMVLPNTNVRPGYYPKGSLVR